MQLLALADKSNGTSAVVRAFELAWADSQVEHGHRDGSPEDSHLYQRLGPHVLFAGPALRGALEELVANQPAQQGLARHGPVGRPAYGPGADRQDRPEHAPGSGASRGS